MLRLIHWNWLNGFAREKSALLASLLLVMLPAFAASAGTRLPEIFEPERATIAQQPETEPSNPTRDAAIAATLEGTQLYDEGTPESLRAALQKWEKALSLWKELGDAQWQAITLSNIGNACADLGENQKALDSYNQALLLYRAAGNKNSEADTLSAIGRVYSDIGEKQKALDSYNQSLLLYRAAGDKSAEADTLNQIGLIYSYLGENQKALDSYNQALPLRRAVDDKRGEATLLSNIGRVYDDIGENQTALDYYNQSLPLRRAVGDKSGEAVTLNNIGAAYDDIGEKQKALDSYNQALPLSRGVDDKSGEAVTLSNIGKVYSDLGEKQKALDYYNQSLPLRRAVSDKRGEATTLNNMGKVYSDLGEKQKALDYYNQSLPLYRGAGDKRSEAVTLNNIGIVYDDLGEKQKALDYYAQSLSLSRAVGDKGGEATTLNNIGGVYFDIGEKQKALDYYTQALPLYRGVGDKRGEAISLYNLADFDRSQGNLTAALSKIEDAIKIIEELRTKIASSELRASYFATVQGYYEFYIDLLMQLHKTNPLQGFDGKALHALERSKARSLLELLAEARADIRTGVEPKLLEKERTLQQNLDTLEKNRLQLSLRHNAESQLAELEKTQQNLLAQYQEVRAQIRQSSPRYAALTQPQPLTLLEIQQQVLDETTLLLSYSLGAERSYLWAVTKTSLSSYELPPRAEIEAIAGNLRKSLIQVSTRYLPNVIAEAAAPLSQILLAPVASQLGKKRLLIVADGALQYIPFSALPVPGKTEVPLIVEHEIVNLPSASTLAILRRDTAGRTPAPKALAVLADPIFNPDDERLKGTSAEPSEKNKTAENLPIEAQQLHRAVADAGVNWNRLPFTRSEAEQILALVPVGEEKQAFDFRADRATATSADLSQYRIVHFATHGFANTENPTLSGIVLSLFDERGTPQNGYLRLNDIFNLNLPAELVVLSACQTGLGKEIKGEGLVGLTRGFMYAGAPRVVVSLWNVNDKATAELMVRFYQKMLKEQLAPAAALRAAQIEFLQQTEWQSPYYWAAFGLQGEWR